MKPHNKVLWSEIWKIQFGWGEIQGQNTREARLFTETWKDLQILPGKKEGDNNGFPEDLEIK